MNEDTEFICPNTKCDYKGKPKYENYGSSLVMFILLLFGILPGIVYLAVAMGKKYYCPNCKIVLDKQY